MKKTKQWIAAVMAVLTILCLSACEEEPLWGTGTPPELTVDPSDYIQAPSTDVTDPTDPLPTDPLPTDPLPTDPPEPEIPIISSDIILQEPIEIPVSSNMDHVQTLDAAGSVYSYGSFYNYEDNVFYIAWDGKMIRKDAAISEFSIQHKDTELKLTCAICEHEDVTYLHDLDSLSSSDEVSRFYMLEGSTNLAVVYLQDDTIYLLDVHDGTVTEPLAGLDENIRVSKFSPNGSYAWWGKRYVLDCRTGEQIKLPMKDISYSRCHAQFISDDKLLIYEEGSKGKVYLYDLKENVVINYKEQFSSVDVMTAHRAYLSIDTDTDCFHYCNVLTGEQFIIPVEIHAGVNVYQLADGRWCVDNEGLLYLQNDKGELIPTVQLER